MIRKQDDIVGSALHDIAHLIRLKIDETLRPYDLTRLKWLAIGILSDNQGLTQTGLAERLELKPAATGKLVDRLVERGLVERRAVPDDRRARALFATEKSYALLAELEPLSEHIRDGILSGLSDHEVRTLGRVLEKVKSNLTATFAGAATSFALSQDMALVASCCAAI